ncbi:MAG: hypothetical protein QNJ74_02280 [Trichodesmium sp. MO_231.B1]|nr:hypothetical protein [Trichodesmium sp. MO_231.B1]
MRSLIFSRLVRLSQRLVEFRVGRSLTSSPDLCLRVFMATASY